MQTANPHTHRFGFTRLGWGSRIPKSSKLPRDADRADPGSRTETTDAGVKGDGQRKQESANERQRGRGAESEALHVPIPGKGGAGQPALRPGRPVSARPAPGPACPPTSS